MSDKTRCESKEAEFDRQFLEIIKPQMSMVEHLFKSRIAFIAVPVMSSKQAAEAIDLADRNMQQMVEVQDE